MSDARAVANTFALRRARYGTALADSLRAVYGEAADSLVERVDEIMWAAAQARNEELRLLDEARLLSPDWLQQPTTLGYVAYADRFGGTLEGVGGRLDYLRDLGVTYLHLMPLLKPRDGENDGGYAVADYREVRADLGTIDDLATLAGLLRQHGISLVLDLVLNHVAREHEWARRARAGEQKYRDYFLIYPDRTEPDAFERTLPEVFPDFAPGNFSHDDEAGGWVWTTFNSYQWDVDWSNPDIFCEFLDIILFLANAGVEVIRLDAIAFIWKRLGTDCQNQPEVHHLTQALRQAVRIVAPACAFKAEAIVGPGDLIHYLGTGAHHGKVSDLAYHNSLMVQLWSALAARHTGLLEIALANVPAKPTTATWGTYVRCHDDIGWAISDADAAAAMIDGHSHRSFLSDFYSGEFPGSFAQGMVFQFNPATNDRRISGTCASLAGLELAVQSQDQYRIDDAIRRIVLLHTVVLGFGGVPLLYMGDELGMLNDYGYLDDPAHADDNRWLHRPAMDWALAAESIEEPGSIAGRIRSGLRHVIGVRANTPHLHASVESRVVPSPDPRLLLLQRKHPLGTMLQVYNFSEGPTYLPCEALRDRLGMNPVELLSGYEYSLAPHGIRVDPYQAMWFVSQG